ncbi:MAG TPA: beta-ketoacyl synthase N-terminal-like domain-containing protein, partial [Polyangiaceae bacterium]
MTIAVVGLGCILPDANSSAEFWANCVGGHSALGPLSSRTYDWNCYKRESESAQRVFESPLGAEIAPHAFDWRKFKISPLDAQSINPMHLHVLEAGAQAIEDIREIPHASSGVFVGGTGLGWRRDSGLRIRLADFLAAADSAAAGAGLLERDRQNLLAKVRGTLDARLRPVNDDGVVNSLGSIAAGRLALRFDLRGPHAGIDAGFASGLAAVSTAARLLLDGTIDMALAGGASECISPLELLAFHQLSVLAPRHVRPFDAAAEGTLLGEGAVLFALKRLEDAVDQGERIYAVLRGVGAASDGRSHSLLAPAIEGQTLAMHRAYAEAEIDPTSIGYVECHATGTSVGDASEIRALAQVFGKAAGIAVASAKPFVGHLRGASGAVGLLRAVLALHHGIVPAQIGFERPHANLALDTTPFFVPTKQITLEARAGAPSARAAVNSFGLGGNNYHAILEAFPSGSHRPNLGSSATRTVSHVAKRADAPIAIIGLGGVLPNGDDVPAFWQALIEGKDATTEVPSSRWQIDRYYDSDQTRLETSYTKVGCFVEPVPDPGREFRLPPAAKAQLDPGHVLAFRAAEEAVADAELEGGSWDRSRTAVILGFIPCKGRRLLAEARLNFREFESELEHALLASGIDEGQVARILAETERIGLTNLPSITEDTLPGYLGSFNAARIARRFDLHGPHFVVESACASSLAALHAAARLLRQGAVDAVILGGVWA